MYCNMLNYWEAYSPEQMAIQSQKLAQTLNLLLSQSFKSVSLIARVKRSGEAPPPPLEPIGITVLSQALLL